MDDLMSNDNIRRDVPILNESSLGVVNEIREVGFSLSARDLAITL